MEVQQLNTLYERIRLVLVQARQRAAVAVNSAAVQAYWEVGRMIVEEEQQGADRAAYGKYLLREISQRLSIELGKGFDESNLRNIRAFYLAFPIRDALRHELTWTHYRLLARVENDTARQFYTQETIDCQWNTRTLERQIHALYYERLLRSRERRALREEENAGNAPLRPQDILRDPYLLDFLGLRPFPKLSESVLEQALIDKLQAFLLELGRGFAFVARQQRMMTETKNRFIDLVFYNIPLKCYVLIDLKTGELDHSDIGQMDMYVRMYEDKVRSAEDNPTIGLILCTEKDATVVRYSVLNESQQLFASKYKLVLPSEEELRQELEHELEQIRLEQRLNHQP